MLSSSRRTSGIIRHYELDRDNTVVIEVSTPMGEDMLDDTDVDAFVPDEALPPEEQAADIVAAAREEAEQILNDAKAAGVAEQEALRLAAKSEADVLREKARNDGYQEGITQATREGDNIRAEARKVLIDAKNERRAMQEACEPEMVALLIDIADKLLHNAVSLNPDVIRALVRMGMQNATITGEVKIYVSVNDYSEVVAHKDEIKALTDGSVKLEIIKGPSLGPMDCVIETPFGSIDASLEQQFEALKQNITYLLNVNTAGGAH